MAPLADIRESDLHGVIDEMKTRLARSSLTARVDELWTTTFLLMGLRYSPDIIGELMQGVKAMEESVT